MERGFDPSELGTFKFPLHGTAGSASIAAGEEAMSRSSMVRPLATISALVGWAALALQLVLIIRMFGPALGPWRYVGFFTILSNIAVASIATAVALGRDSRLTGAKARLAGLTAIVTVGFVYSVVLRALWHPTGWQKVADAGLHDATPVLFALLWAVMPHGALQWRDVGGALVGPAVYLGYALARGRVDGWYPYFFIDPTTQSVASLLGNIAGVIAVFGIVAASAIAIDRRMGARAAALAS